MSKSTDTEYSLIGESPSFQIRNFASFFQPLCDFDPTDKPKNLHEKVDPFLRHPITRELIGYAEINNVIKFFFPAWDMIMHPEQALKNQEHVGSLTWIFTPMVPLAIYSSLLGSKLLDLAHDNKAYYALYAASCIIRWPLIAIGLLFNALSQITLYLTAVSLALSFVAIGAALILGLSPLIAAGYGLFSILEKDPNAKTNEEPKIGLDSELEEKEAVPSL